MILLYNIRLIRVETKSFNIFRLFSSFTSNPFTGRKTKNWQDYLAKKALPIFAYFHLFLSIFAYFRLF
jgi:hypothetical protein